MAKSRVFISGNSRTGVQEKPDFAAPFHIEDLLRFPPNFGFQPHFQGTFSPIFVRSVFVHGNPCSSEFWQLQTLLVVKSFFGLPEAVPYGRRKTGSKNKLFRPFRTGRKAFVFFRSVALCADRKSWAKNHAFRTYVYTCGGGLRSARARKWRT